MIRTLLYASVCLTLASQERPVLVQNVRIFDGERVLKADSVRFAQGRISEVGKNLAPNGADVVDGTGHTLLPGLIDSHVHAYGDALQQSLVFGVTTVIDCFTDPAYVRQAKARASKTEADLLSSGYLATVPKGHGTEYPLQVPTLTQAGEAPEWVKARVAEGSDFIKIVMEDGKAFNHPFPSLEPPVVAALVKAAHGEGKLAVVHTSTEADSHAVLAMGADGLAHVWGDVPPRPETIRLLQQKGRFVMPTLSVFQACTSQPLGPALAKEAFFAPFVHPSVAQALGQQMPWQKAAAGMFPVGLEATRTLHKAGVTLLAGTDAPNPGTTFGLSLHGELALLVQAGLSPMEALRTATAAPAMVFGMKDRGRIQAGLRADLVLVKGDPTVDITATRGIAQVWKQGEALNRGLAAQQVTEARKALAQAAPVQTPVRWTFESDADLAAWLPSTDAMAGGGSTVKLTRHPQGGLHVTGTIDGKLPFAWAGLMWMPGGDFMKGKDMRGLKSVSFRVSGSGKARLMFYTTTGGFRPQEKAFEVTPEGNDVVLPLSAFKGDLSKVNALILAAGPTPGPLDLRIQDLRVE